MGVLDDPSEFEKIENGVLKVFNQGAGLSLPGIPTVAIHRMERMHFSSEGSFLADIILTAQKGLNLGLLRFPIVISSASSLSCEVFTAKSSRPAPRRISDVRN